MIISFATSLSIILHLTLPICQHWNAIVIYSVLYCTGIPTAKKTDESKSPGKSHELDFELRPHFVFGTCKRNSRLSALTWGSATM